MSSTIHRILTTALTAAVLFASSPHEQAPAFLADFFEKSTSGQAVYEDMAVGPQAVDLDGKTLVVYQGWLNAPTVVAYDHVSRRWDGPYKIGDNPLTSGWNPLDTHGAPALHVDARTGHVHVFWGAHGSALLHARTARPGDISSWTPLPSIRHSGGVTYPQVVSYETTQGVQTELFYRTGDAPVNGWASRVATGTLDAIHRSEARPVIEGESPLPGADGYRWYVTFRAGADGRVHMAAIMQAVPHNPFDRQGVFYLYRDPGEVCWRTITGEEVGTTESPVPDLPAIWDTSAKVYWDEGSRENQVSLAVSPDGDPLLLFVSGSWYGVDSHDWKVARWDPGSQEWGVRSLVKTDHYMDSGALEFPSADPDHVEAYLVAGGTRGNGSAERPYADRGGDIWRYVSGDGGSTWSIDRIVRRADADRGEVYNDPQIVRSGVPGTRTPARLLFCQWDNVADNFVHKVFLWGEDGFAHQEFLPGMRRLEGPTRVETAVSVSRESFPLGSNTVFIVSGDIFTDALSGVPLAYSHNAPMLFTRGAGLAPAVSAEIKRLRGTRTRGLDVIILGGPNSVSQAAETQLRALPDTRSVRRISGRDRYEVSRNIALELANRVGAPRGVFIASGEVFPDALAVSPIAAAKGYPVLLNPRDRLGGDAESTIVELGVETVTVVGGPNTLAAGVTERIEQIALGGARRVWGGDRYETAVAVSEMGLTGVDVDQGVLSMDRFVLASGEVFPDALAGGVFAARLRGPIVLTQGAALSRPAEGFLSRNGFEVLDAYVLGGPMTISPVAANRTAAVLHERRHAQR